MPAMTVGHYQSLSKTRKRFFLETVVQFARFLNFPGTFRVVFPAFFVSHLSPSTRV